MTMLKNVKYYGYHLKFMNVHLVSVLILIR